MALTREQLIESATGKKPDEEQTESSTDLRHEIRTREQKLRQRIMGNADIFDADLPSEDHLMDNPKKFDANMRKVLKKLEAIEKAVDAYQGASAWK